MISFIVVCVIAVISLVLGFIALLKQKLYLDPQTGETTESEIEIPVIGRLKTKYPALIIVFLGIVLTYLSFQKSIEIEQSPNEWIISGSFKEPEGDASPIKWSAYNFSTLPTDIQHHVSDKSANFSITVPVKKGKKFEEVYKQLNFEWNSYSKWAQISIAQDLENFHNGKDSDIKNVNGYFIEYKPIKINHTLKEEDQP